MIAICEICRQIPCHPRCPNAIHKIKSTCEICGEELYEGEYYTTDNSGGIYCSDECAKKANGIREKEWEDE